MLEKDERGQIALAAVKQKTKTGKDELSEADLVSEVNQEEEEEESKSRSESDSRLLAHMADRLDEDDYIR